MPILQAATYSECQCCGSRRFASQEQYGCDSCQQPLSEKSERFDITVFFDSDETKSLYFDKLACAFAWLARFEVPKGFRFMTLPYLSSPANVGWLKGHLTIQAPRRGDGDRKRSRPAPPSKSKSKKKVGRKGDQ